MYNQEIFKYIKPYDSIIAYEEKSYLKRIEKFIIYVEQTTDIHHHDDRRYFFYFSGHSPVTSPVDFPYAGAEMFNPVNFHSQVQNLVENSLDNFKYVLPQNDYELDLYRKITNSIAAFFPSLLKVATLNVLNGVSVHSYNSRQTNALYKSLLNFNFDEYVTNVKVFVDKITIPSYDLNKINTEISASKNIFNSCYWNKNVLGKHLLSIYLLEWRLYFQTSILVSYAKLLNVQIQSLKKDNIFEQIQSYSRRSLNSSKNTKIIRDLIYKYYYSLPIRRHQRFGYRWNTEFTFQGTRFGLVDFSNILKFSAYKFNDFSYDSVNGRLKNCQYDMTKSFDSFGFETLAINLNQYCRIQKLEAEALLDLSVWKNLGGREYEYEVLKFFNQYLDLSGSVTKASQDRGIDLIIDNRIAIQCKNQLQKVSSSVMRGFVGSCVGVSYPVHIFITAVGYTKEARRAAKLSNVILLTTRDIVNVISGRCSVESFKNRISGHSSQLSLNLFG